MNGFHLYYEYLHIKQNKPYCVGFYKEMAQRFYVLFELITTIGGRGVFKRFSRWRTNCLFKPLVFSYFCKNAGL